MKKKKKHAKLQQHNTVDRRWHFAHLRFASLICPKSKLLAACLPLLIQIGCVIATPNNFSTKVRYTNPPVVGSWLQSQRELVACETELAARHMANFGFFHPQCTQLTNIGQREYLVQSLHKVQLSEGPMWLLMAQRRQTIYWIPIPWHDWL